MVGIRARCFVRPARAFRSMSRGATRFGTPLGRVPRGDGDGNGAGSGRGVGRGRVANGANGGDRRSRDAAARAVLAAARARVAREPARARASSHPARGGGAGATRRPAGGRGAARRGARGERGARGRGRTNVRRRRLRRDGRGGGVGGQGAAAGRGPERASAPVGAGDAADGEEKAARARRRGGRVFGGMRASRAYPKARGGRGRERRAGIDAFATLGAASACEIAGGRGVRGQHIPFLTTWEIENARGNRGPTPSRRAHRRPRRESRKRLARHRRGGRARSARASSVARGLDVSSARAPARPFSPPLVAPSLGDDADRGDAFSSTRSRKLGYAPNGCPVSGIGHRRSWAPRIDRLNAPSILFIGDS